jgi:L-ascorbate metabolism protein UlaG (beta-lactamase superfamily)
MEMTWLGTAGFIVKGLEGEIAFDPFLSRDSDLYPNQNPKSPFGVKSFENTQAIFVGHGHFDHTYDIPKIVTQAELQVFAPGLTGRILSLRGVPKKCLVNAQNKSVLFRPFKMRAFLSSHVRFDFPLVISTMKRCGIKGCLHTLGLGIGYPQGLVQTYAFESEGKKFLFMSSAGCSENELKEYRKLEIDYLLAPLQGHSHIQKIAADQTLIINPKVVIPHHHDDFYPPLSQNITVDVFRDHLKMNGFKGQVLEIPLFGTIHL